MTDKTQTETVIDLLSKLEKQEVVTQSSLAKRVQVSVGLVNALLKRAINKGYVKVRAAPYKRYAYYLTPEGFLEKSRLVTEYLENSLSFFRIARDGYETLFIQARKQGGEKFILVGSGELAEIAILAARNCSIDLVAILDHKINKIELQGVPIIHHLEPQQEQITFILTEQHKPQAVYDMLVARHRHLFILVPDFLHVKQA